ncbi:aspartate--tRNA ligase [Brochothrix campestris]|uniref:Aspartate--tRNA ligase n=1 Tax=Brochothrix campestris FSL F6-1037 TaxID=1265861 RepID=W7CPU8_9LIST|nr:aspartate--tRNA ligase [Brochothrix campestris]EUJ41684.1 aspartyl-tRNA ligase [Brochothrix campestris FSL F6-1037]
MDKRTTYCGLVTTDFVGQEVTLSGWVQKRRDLGGLIFIDLRDREGAVQIVFNPDESKEALAIAENVRGEYVITIKGKVVERAAAQVNTKIKTGAVEVLASSIEVLNAAKTPPFYIEDGVDVSDDLRLKYRYLDLRRPEMSNIIRKRHDIKRAVRNTLDDLGFLDIETPMLNKSTPEGARDYLVPSRVHPGHFYALPQSPQLNKQLLMAAGFDKYYQIVRCFRDEDLRGDRQPEFTQIDIETSFQSAEEIQTMTESLLKAVVKEAKGIDIPTPFPRMEYDEAMARYGSDKPDVRFGLELVDVADVVAESDFKVFTQAIEMGGQVKAINIVGGGAAYSRKQIDAMGEFVKIYGSKGLAWVKVEEGELKGPIAKFFDATKQAELIAKLDGHVGDMFVFVADKASVVAASLGALRGKVAKEMNLINEDELAFLWVVNWPLFEYDEEENRFVAAHHPFTMPNEEDVALLDTKPEAVYAQAYDVVLNGYELGGGSLRIYDSAIQAKMFKALGFTEEEARAQFGFLMDAFEYGTPPHGGIALGLDRVVMLLTGRDNIRDTIAFPKTGRASDPMTQAPSAVSAKQLAELQLDITEKAE